MNQFNALHSKEPNEPPRAWNSQPPEDQFKFRTYTTNTSPMISAFTGRLNHHAIDNSYVEVHPS